jgi:hypothetical protein
MYKNGKMRPVETILRMAGGGIKENDGGVNLTKIYCKHFCKCHNIFSAQQKHDNKTPQKQSLLSMEYGARY